MATWTLPQNNVSQGEAGHLADHDDIYGCLDQVMNVVSPLLPSTDVTGVTDLANITAALAASNIATLAPGTFYIDAAIPMAAGQTLAGAGSQATIINQVSTTADAVAISGTGTMIGPAIRDLYLHGPNSGSGRGISAISSGGASPIAQLSIQNVFIRYFGGAGVDLSTVITSVLDNVEVWNSGGTGFYLRGSGGCTSVVFNGCYANGCTARGYYISGAAYCSLNGCASDSNYIGYEVNGGENIVLNGCGAEGTAAGGALDGSSFKFSGGGPHTATGCYNNGNNAVGFYLSGGIGLFTGCKEASPGGSATASFKTAAGTEAVMQLPVYVTATSLAGGTVQTPVSVYPSGDATGATDLAAINAAIAAGGIVQLPPNTSSNPFYIDGAILVGSYQSLTGSGAGPAGTYIEQVSTTANAVTIANSGFSTDILNPTVRGIWFNGPASGSGAGIGGGGSTQVIEGLHLSDCVFNAFGGSGVALQTVIASCLDNVNSASNGAAGFYIYGSGGYTPTSLTLRNCYAHSNVAWGYYIVDTNYCSLLSCAADVNGSDGVYNYQVDGGNNVAFVGCGHEQAASPGNGSAGGYKINGGAGHSLTSCFTVLNPGVAFWVTGSAVGCTLISCQENTPGSGATASFKVDSGSGALVIQPTYTTAQSLAGSPGTINGAIWPLGTAEALGSGESVIQRIACQGDMLMVTGVMDLTYWVAATSGVATSVITFSGSVTAATPQYSAVYVFSIDGSGNLTQIATTGDIHSTAWLAQYTAYTSTLTTHFTRVAGTRYAIGFLQVGGTMPHLAGMGAGIGGLVELAPMLAGQVTMGASTVASGSNGGEISTIASWAHPSSGVLDVAASTSFPSGGGTVLVAASGTTYAIVTYTGTGTGTLTGCAYVSGSATGTVATGNAVTQINPATVPNGSVALYQNMPVAVVTP